MGVSGNKELGIKMTNVEGARIDVQNIYCTQSSGNSRNNIDDFEDFHKFPCPMMLSFRVFQNDICLNLCTFGVRLAHRSCLITISMVDVATLVPIFV